MAQVTRTTNDVIINSLYLLGELGVGEAPDGFMLSTGIDLLNELLDKFSADGIYIPYMKTIDFNTVANQDTYSVSDMVPADISADRIIDLVFANWSLPSPPSSTVTYPLRIISKAEYFGIVRYQQLATLPAYIVLDRQATTSYLIIYPAPNQAYPVSVKCKVMLDKLTAYSDLSELPPNYYGFLKRALARIFKSYYPSGNWTEQMEDEYQDYFNTFKNANETELTISPSRLLTTNGAGNWQTVIGNVWAI